jgi:hypothetical protein
MLVINLIENNRERTREREKYIKKKGKFITVFIAIVNKIKNESYLVTVCSYTLIVKS